MRLIDAHDVLGKIVMMETVYVEDVVESIITSPTVDAVPVIRCKDCKHRDEQSANCTRFRKDWYVQSNSFCSWAERKEE